jgi:hypothetical protein
MFNLKVRKISDKIFFLKLGRNPDEIEKNGSELLWG